MSDIGPVAPSIRILCAYSEPISVSFHNPRENRIRSGHIGQGMADYVFKLSAEPIVHLQVEAGDGAPVVIRESGAELHFDLGVRGPSGIVRGSGRGVRHSG